MSKVLDSASGENYTIYNGDCIEVVQGLPDNSVHFSVFSPPFSSLYVYSNSSRDMGNCKGDDEFREHFLYLVHELYRVLKPGRLISIHCMNLPASKQHDGFIGIKDFRGDLIRAFINDEAAEFSTAIERLKYRLINAVEADDMPRVHRIQDAIQGMEVELLKHPGNSGFIYHSEVCIWKDPVTAMQRTKAIGLLHKQLCKDSTISRQGIPDYLVTFRKPGENPEPVKGELTEYAGTSKPRVSGDKTRDSINIWQQYASPVWMDVNPSDTLQYQSARDNNDERHICPLALPVIQRAVQLWTNPGDVVFTPFMGIGSEVYQAVKMGRKGLGVELKPSYFKCAKKNLAKLEQESSSSLLPLLELANV